MTSSPEGVNCGDDCSEGNTPDTTVTLTATPDAGAAFVGWTGGGCTGTGACVVTLTADTSIEAAFAKQQFTVTVTPNGNGTGRVTSTPAGIDCGGTCNAKLDIGTQVMLLPAPGTGSTFVGWTGGGCTGTGPCIVTIAADTTLQASFVLNNSLVVTRAGNGTGTVTSNDGKINCGTTCSNQYSPNSAVTLTATPGVSSNFTGWAGGGCSGTGTCTVTINQATGLVATFTLKQFTLTVAKTGNGNGTITSTDNSINCGSTCVSTHNYGDTVTLNAAPTTGSTFTGWSGGNCTGTGTCTVTLTVASTITATFNLIPQTLAITRTGTGGGTVTSNPAGINCGTACMTTYSQGTMVTLTATPEPNSVFAGWSGACTGTGPCTVTLNTATTVNVVFNATTFATSSGWNCGIGVSCQDVYDFSFASNTTVTVSVSSVTGASVLRLGAFGPGTALGGSDLFTGLTFDRRCFGQNVGDTISFRATTAGTYRIAVGRDWNNSLGASGTYMVTVSANSAMSFLGQTVNDGATGATGMQCGYTFSTSAGWNCAVGVSCQDVYDFTTLAATPVSVAVTSVTNYSVVRMAVFDGSALNTTNRLNGTLADRMCAAQNANDSATSANLPIGQHRIAVGRDWGESANTGGTYLVTITTASTPLSPGGLTSNDIASSFSSTSCP